MLCRIRNTIVWSVYIDVNRGIVALTLHASMGGPVNILGLKEMYMFRHAFSTIKRSNILVVANSPTGTNLFSLFTS